MKRSLQKKFAAALLLCGVIAVGAVALATTVMHLNWDDMVQAADRIVVGNVIDAKVHWNPAKTKIYTTYEIEVSDNLFGVSTGTLKVRQLGGSLDGVTSFIPGSPSFKNGEEVLLFLENRPDGAYTLVGFTQGKCFLERNTDGRLVVKKSNPNSSVVIIKPAGNKPVDSDSIMFDELKMLIDQRNQ